MAKRTLRQLRTDQREAKRVITALGGTGAAADFVQRCGASVSEWKHNGIPRAMRSLLALQRPDLFTTQPRHAPRNKSA